MPVSLNPKPDKEFVTALVVVFLVLVVVGIILW